MGYDTIADWYETEFLAAQAGSDPVGARAALRELLGVGDGAVCLEVGCGTGTVARVLRPGGVFVHVGVHPCFCGGFADRTDPEAVVIRPGYLDGHFTFASWTDAGVRSKVGASHWPLPGLLRMFTDAGLVAEAYHEGGAPSPVTFSMRLRKG